MTYQQIYNQAIANGATPLFADMLASRQPPGTSGTDRAFMQGRMHNNGIPDTMPKNLRNRLLETAQRAGVDIAGKWYCSGLAEYPEDPKAWVASRDDVLDRVKQKGWVAEGNVSYKPAETPLTPRERRQEKRKQEKKHARA